MKRGFITLATGDIYYYRLASNLLKSYKYRAGKFPFAILCDRKNEYTELFDEVVILDKPHNNYLDKFRILVDAPFDESFFIEPDCLIYEEIDCFWNYFKDATDCSSFGWNDSEIGTFLNTEDIKRRFDIHKAPLFCPGYIFVRKGELCTKIYEDAISVAKYLNEHKEIHPAAFVGNNLRDDPVFFCALAMNHCTCAVKPSVAKCINYPSFRYRNHHYPAMNIREGYLEDDKAGECARLCHFSTKHTRLGKYNQQVWAMKCYLNGWNFLGQFLETTFMEKLFFAYFMILSKIKK